MASWIQYIHAKTIQITNTWNGLLFTLGSCQLIKMSGYRLNCLGIFYEFLGNFLSIHGCHTDFFWVSGVISCLGVVLLLGSTCALGSSSALGSSCAFGSSCSLFGDGFKYLGLPPVWGSFQCVKIFFTNIRGLCQISVIVPCLGILPSVWGFFHESWDWIASVLLLRCCWRYIQ